MVLVREDPLSDNCEVNLIRRSVAALNAGDIEGVHTGEYGDIAPTHREIVVKTCEVYPFTGDKVTECHVYGETMSLFNQLSGERA
jgi:hypothetical protein